MSVLVGSMAYFSAGNLKLLSVLSGGVAAHAICVALNHTLSHAGRAEFCQQGHLPPEVRTTVGVLRFGVNGPASATRPPEPPRSAAAEAALRPPAAPPRS